MFWNNKVEDKSVKDIETKAVSSFSGAATTMTTVIPDTVKLTQDPVKLMNYNRGYVFAANELVADAVGALPYRMYAYIPKERAAGLAVKNSVIEQKRARHMTKAMKLNPGEQKTLVELYDHPFLDLMKNPAPGWTQTEFMKVISAYLGLIGNAYIEIVVEAGQVIMLRPLLSEFMRIRYDGRGEITEYLYQPTNTMKAYSYTPDDILHIRNRTAGSVIGGMGNLEAALASTNLTTSTQAYLSALLTNMAMPGGVFTVKNFSGTAEQADKFTNKLLERFGKRNRGKPMVTFGDVEYTKNTATMMESRADFFTEQAKKEIAACFRVPLTLLDESNSNRATALAAKSSMQVYAVYPRAGAILDQLNTRVVNKYYDAELMYHYDVSEAIEADPKEQAEVLKIYVDAGVYTVNEARQALGMQDLGTDYDKPERSTTPAITVTQAGAQ